MDIFLQLHSYWAYLTLATLIFTVFNSLIKWLKKVEFNNFDLRIALFTLIFIHIQFLIGLAWYFMSPAYKHLKEIGMGAAMKDSLTRLLTVEHPLLMILAIVLISIGFSNHKKKKSDSKRFKTLTIYYGIALLFILSRIPWEQWFS